MSTPTDLVDLQRYITLQKDIANELDARVRRHQARIATLDEAFAEGPRPLNLLADGDSWFDYPLGGFLPGEHTDVLAQLGGMGSPPPMILSLAHWGDAATKELGLSRRQRMVQNLLNPSNGRFDAILMSGGGDDIVGDPMPIWLNHASDVGADPAQAIANDRFNAILDTVRASYESLAILRTRHAPGVPTFIHDYDFAIPTGVGVCMQGPWLKPTLDYYGWTDQTVGAGIVHDMLSRFATVLRHFADTTPDVVLVRTQGTLEPSQWANELHPTPEGFKLIAAKFQVALGKIFRGRL